MRRLLLPLAAAVLLSGLAPAFAAMRRNPIPVPMPHAAKPLKTPKPKGAASRPAAERPVNPLLRGLYDASRRRTLATCRNGRTINEEDLLLYGLLIDAPDADIYGRYLKETNPDLKADMQLRIKRRIVDLACLETLGAQEAAGAALDAAERLNARVMQYPVWEFAWIRRMIWPRIVIMPGDERHYYTNHPMEFVTPRRATVRYIYRRVDESFASEDLLIEQQLMESLRVSLVDDPALFPKAAQEFSQAPSAAEGGLIPAFEPGQYFPEFEQWVFDRLEPGEISNVLRGPRGLYLVQLIDLRLPEPITFEKAQAKLQEAVRTAQARARASYEIEHLVEEGHAEDRFAYWDQLLDSSRVVKVGDLKLTKGEFLQLYPSILTVTGAVDAAELQWRGKRLIESELIARALRKSNLLADPSAVRGRAMAETLVRARRAEKRWIAEQIRVSGQGNSDQLARKLAQSKTVPRKRLFRLWAEVDTPRLYDATTLANLREGLPRALQGYIDQCEASATGAETAERKTQVPLAVRKISSYIQRSYKFHWSDLGYVNLAGSPQLADLLRTVPVGRFSPVETQDEKAVAYYVGAEKAMAPETFEDLWIGAQRDEAERRRNALVGIYRDALAQGLAITFSLE